MNEIRMPALTGDSPLSVLAAIGVLRLLSDFTDDSPKLRWDPTALTAVLCGQLASIDAVVAELQGIVDGITIGSVLPGAAVGFPPPGAAPDGLRVSRTELRSFNNIILGDMRPAQQREAQRWLSSLVTDLAVDDKGRVAISQFTAPSGKQSMATMLDKPLDLIRKEPDYLRQALVGWRRIPGVTGEYLDHRAMWDAAEDGAGSNGAMRGVPGATWLALMSYPLFRTTAISLKRPWSSGWHTIRKPGVRPYEELRLPVWDQPLGPHDVTALVEHPAIAPSRIFDDADRADAHAALGVIRVCRARRYQPPGSKSAGVLTTVS